ncbi:MAG: hypothetical protein LBC13_02050 [Clostridiales bacterium]|jgi:hypothetical protein|nr:hypothetical protein [Clostridiales bacterium]
MAKKKSENIIEQPSALPVNEEAEVTVEIKEQERPKQISLEDELFRDIMSEDSAEENLSALLRPANRPMKKKPGKAVLHPKHIIFLTATVIVIAGIVLAIVLPGVLANRASNYAEAFLSNNSITMSVNATGALEFYNSTPVPASFAPDVFVFEEIVGMTEDEIPKPIKKNRGYRILKINISNDVKLIDLIEKDPEFVLIEMVCINTSGAPWESDGGDMVGKTVYLRAGDVLTVNELDPDAEFAVSVMLANAFVSYVNVQAGQTITSASAALFMVTDYTTARVRFNISAYEINNIKTAEAAAAEPLTVRVSFTSPRGSLTGTLQPLSRNSTEAYADIVISDSRQSAVNIFNVIGNAQVAVSIQMGNRSGIVAPVYAIFNDGSKDYVLMKRSGRSEQLEPVEINIQYSDGVKAIITSSDPRVKINASIYYEKSDGFLSGLGI